MVSVASLAWEAPSWSWAAVKSTIAVTDDAAVAVAVAVAFAANVVVVVTVCRSWEFVRGLGRFLLRWLPATALAGILAADNVVVVLAAAAWEGLHGTPNHNAVCCCCCCCCGALVLVGVASVVAGTAKGAGVAIVMSPFDSSWKLVVGSEGGANSFVSSS